MSTAEQKRDALARRVRARELVQAPGVFDLVSARVADRLGFEALYLSGYAVVASHLGLPDAGLASYTDMVERTRTIAEATTTPLLADGDTGYGGLLNVRHTVRGYEAAGAAGIQLEDQDFPKKCGHTSGRHVIATADMVRKLQVALQARSHADFLIVARTDARSELGLDEALRRARAYAETGADLVFVESPESEAELERIGSEIDAPLVANMVESGRTPILPTQRLRELGFGLVIHPLTGLAASVHALSAAYGHLRRRGTSQDAPVPLEPLESLHDLLGFPEVWDFEKRWTD